MAAEPTPTHGTVTSEVGTLRAVLLHRPGDEVHRLTPSNMGEYLFDDLLWTARAQEEHDAFAEVLRSRGVRVHYVRDLLAGRLAAEDGPGGHATVDRATVVDAVTRHRDDPAGALVRAVAATLDAGALADLALAGATAQELRAAAPAVGVPDANAHCLSIALAEPRDMVVPPTPNLLFTRDPAFRIHDRVYLGAMHSRVRRREPTLMGIGLQDPAVAPAVAHPATSPGGTVEGGDVLVVSPECLVIGLSERTDAVGITRLAASVFAETPVRRIEVVQLPKQRALMHLDTAVTMVDERSFVAFGGLGELVSATVTPASDAPGDAPGHAVAALDVQRHEPAGIGRILQRALGTEGPEVRIITADQDAPAAEREQWEDGCNLLALAPGVVVAYERNVVTNEHLRDLGIEVLEIPGGELGRGRGGPRCMCNPVDRSPLDQHS